MFWGKRSRPVFTHFPGVWPNVWGARERGFNCVLSSDVFCSGCYWAWHFEEANAREMSCRCHSRAWVVVWVPCVCPSRAGTLARCRLQSWGAPGLPLGGVTHVPSRAQLPRWRETSRVHLLVRNTRVPRLTFVFLNLNSECPGWQCVCTAFTVQSQCLM